VQLVKMAGDVTDIVPKVEVVARVLGTLIWIKVASEPGDVVI
jgi:hypothetical protein